EQVAHDDEGEGELGPAATPGQREGLEARDEEEEERLVVPAPQWEGAPVGGGRLGAEREEEGRAAEHPEGPGEERVHESRVRAEPRGDPHARVAGRGCRGGAHATTLGRPARPPHPTTV